MLFSKNTKRFPIIEKGNAAMRWHNNEPHFFPAKPANSTGKLPATFPFYVFVQPTFKIDINELFPDAFEEKTAFDAFIILNKEKGDVKIHIHREIFILNPAFFFNVCTGYRPARQQVVAVTINLPHGENGGRRMGHKGLPDK